MRANHLTVVEYGGVWRCVVEYCEYGERCGGVWWRAVVEHGGVWLSVVEYCKSSGQL